MSLPISRRIARAALIVAAGAAPVIGAAGAASAAELPVAGTGLNAVDPSTVGDTAGTAVGTATGTASDLADTATTEVVPAGQGAVGSVVGGVAKQGVPAVGGLGG